MELIARDCANSGDLKDSFRIEEGRCYDFLDPEVWSSMTNEPYPDLSGVNIGYAVGSLCTTDMCNLDDDQCELKQAKTVRKSAKSLPDLFGKIQSNTRS